jgi:branched-chain amino acid transport system ATP-binding protein
VGLNKSFGGLKATNNIDFEMKTSELSAIIGPNGAGKSTFFNLLTGYHKVDSGEVLYKGRDITNWPPHKVARLGITRAFQVSNIYPALTTYENIRQAILTEQGRTLDFFTPAERLAKEETLKLVEITGLSQNTNMIAGNLSQGDKKRLELAIALGSKPELVFLDEPTAGMSQEEVPAILEVLEKIKSSRDRTILLVEHKMDMIMTLSDSIAVLQDGRLIADGDPDTIYRSKEVQEAYLGGGAKLE